MGFTLRPQKPIGNPWTGEPSVSKPTFVHFQAFGILGSFRAAYGLNISDSFHVRAAAIATL